MLDKIEVTSKFWRERQRVIREQMIPYQWEVINDFRHVAIAVTNTGGDSSALDSDKSYVVENFLIAAGKKQGKRGGMVFQDSDAYKWLEATAYSLECFPDTELQAKADRLVDIIADAQEEDGYLNTYFTVNEPDRKYQSLYMSHELYCAGHFIEAAVAYYKATGSAKVLAVAERLADNIDKHFGPEEGKIHGADGHEEIELALLRLYELTKQERYLNLSQYLLHVRGQDPEFFRKMQRQDVALGRKSLIQGLEIMHPDFDAVYFQSDRPVEEQTEARGHAVRVVYLCSALASAAYLRHDEKLATAAQHYWDNIVGKRMYVTGAIGSAAHGEAFTADYDLPNDTIYGETCASVGLTFFAHYMLYADKKSVYGDVMERALYNTVLAGMNLDGKGYFYVNPLEANPDYSKRNPGCYHVLTRRPGWFACACCPPNLARMVMSIGHYAYQTQGDTVFSDLFIDSTAHFTLDSGKATIKQQTDYPWDGTITYEISEAPAAGLKLAFRIPEWAQHFVLEYGSDVSHLNKLSVAEVQAQGLVKDGYLYLPESLSAQSQVKLSLTMEPVLIEANPLISTDYGKQAVMRGPIVYCVEEVDNGASLQCLHLGESKDLQGHFEPELLAGVYKLTTTGLRRINTYAPGQLYQVAKPAQYQNQEIVLIPYYAWCNRAEGEMRVWLNPKP